MTGFDVDLGVLDGIARTFHQASEDVDALGSSVPGTPDAGDGTPAIAGILAHFVENTSSLVLGLAGAGDDITAAAQDYRSQDDTASNELEKSSGE